MDIVDKDGGSIPQEIAPSLLDRLTRRTMPGIGPNRGSEQVTTNRAPIGGQHEMRTAGEPALLQDLLPEK